MKNKFKSSTLVPLMLFLYLCLMAWMGRERLADGDYLHYFGVLGVGIVIIVVLHFVLKKKEYYKQKRKEEAEYGTYSDEDKKEK
ncbi:MAG: hypothetical protein Q4B68_05495 [Bacteroidales bacterium]|nr:hypothetical protein [Bacteroidales bacterium]